MKPFVVGTAGHIDHGKSTLVHALTGIDPDRLPEEKRRGITIELGFAHAALVDGVDAAFVDVPGHERFVRTMVAGAQGVDVVLFVVAADEGVMAQTREHADICQLLGIPHAVVALTKSDLLGGFDAEWPMLVEEEIRSLGPLFSAAPIVRISARTGDGLDTLRLKLAEAGRGTPSRTESGAAFLPIDRVFTVRGHGTVVTGTLLAGTLEPDQLIDIAIPAPREAHVLSGRRVRGLQVHGHSVNRATAGQRVAANVIADVAEIPRGGVLTAAGTAGPRQSCLLDVELTVLPGSPLIRNRARLHLHLGTAESLAAIDLLGVADAKPGDSVIAQLRLDRALPAIRDQRFVLRGFRGPNRTVAGGRVLLADRRKRRARDRALVDTLADPPEGRTALVQEAGAHGVDASWLSLWLPGALAKTQVQSGGMIFDRAAVAVPEAKVAPADPNSDRIEALLAESNLTPPSTAEIAVTLKLDRSAVASALWQLAKSGRAVRLTDDLFLHAQAAMDFQHRAVDALRTKGSLTTLELKEMSGASRKFAIPLCEWLDREKITLRVGDKRVLRGQERA